MRSNDKIIISLAFEKFLYPGSWIRGKDIPVGISCCYPERGIQTARGRDGPDNPVGIVPIHHVDGELGIRYGKRSLDDRLGTSTPFHGPQGWSCNGRGTERLPLAANGAGGIYGIPEFPVGKRYMHDTSS